MNPIRTAGSGSRGRGGRRGGRTPGRFSMARGLTELSSSGAEIAKSGSSVARLAGAGVRRIPVAGAVISGGLSAYEGFQENQDINRQLEAGEITQVEATRAKTVNTSSTIGETAGGAGGAFAGAATGAAIGSVVPVVGTIIGGLLGAALGGWLGSKGGEMVGEAVGETINVTREAMNNDTTNTTTTTPEIPSAKPPEETPTEIATTIATPEVPVARTPEVTPDEMPDIMSTTESLRMTSRRAENLRARAARDEQKRKLEDEDTIATPEVPVARTPDKSDDISNQITFNGSDPFNIDEIIKIASEAARASGNDEYEIKSAVDNYLMNQPQYATVDPNTFHDQINLLIDAGLQGAGSLKDLANSVEAFVSTPSLLTDEDVNNMIQNQATSLPVTANVAVPELSDTVLSVTATKPPEEIPTEIATTIATPEVPVARTPDKSDDISNQITFNGSDPFNIDEIIKIASEAAKASGNDEFEIKSAVEDYLINQPQYATVDPNTFHDQINLLIDAGLQGAGNLKDLATSVEAFASTPSLLTDEDVNNMIQNQATSLPVTANVAVPELPNEIADLTTLDTPTVTQTAPRTVAPAIETPTPAQVTAAITPAPVAQPTQPTSPVVTTTTTQANNANVNNDINDIMLLLTYKLDTMIGLLGSGVDIQDRILLESRS